MLIKYLQTAWQNLKQKQSRSLLTILSLVFGISCVTLLINITSGLKAQIVSDGQFDDHVVTVQSGQAVIRNQNQAISQYNFAQTFGISPNLTQADYNIMQNHPAVDAIAPLTKINSQVSNLSGKSLTNGHILATTAQLLEIIDYDLAYGSNILDDDNFIAIIGDEVAKELFNNSQPISHEIMVANQSFLVGGVLNTPQKFDPLNLSFNYRRAVLIPFEAFKKINQAQQAETFIYEVVARTRTPLDHSALSSLNQQILSNHQAQDFSIFKNSELLFMTDQVFKIAQIVVLIIAASFILAGGISLMNALQATVAERRTEIGIRKAVGATNQQIFNQFIVEAVFLSIVGGILGIILGLLIGVFLNYWTPIQPMIKFPMMYYILGLTPVIGLIFGTKPAVQASLQRTVDNLN